MVSADIGTIRAKTLGVRGGAARRHFGNRKVTVFIAKATVRPRKATVLPPKVTVSANLPLNTVTPVNTFGLRRSAGWLPAFAALTRSA